MSAFRGKADMTIGTCPLSWLLSGVKQTSLVAAHMSAFDPKRTCDAATLCLPVHGSAPVRLVVLLWHKRNDFRLPRNHHLGCTVYAMVEFPPFIIRAALGLVRKTRETPLALYQRGTALVSKLRALRPAAPISAKEKKPATRESATERGELEKKPTPDRPPAPKSQRQRNRPAKAPGLASRSVTTSSSSNMRAQSRSIRSKASSPKSRLFCHALLCSSEICERSVRRRRECPLLAQSRHELVHCTCPLLGVKRTCRFAEVRFCGRYWG